jgi:hypothetical protein
MYVDMYVSVRPPFQDLGWVGGWVMGTPCIRLVTSQNMGQKLLTKRVGVMMGGVIWLHLRISRAKWKHFMMDKTHKFVIENHTMHLQMEAFVMIDKTHKVCYKKRYVIHLHPPTHMPLVDSTIGMEGHEYLTFG